VIDAKTGKKARRFHALFQAFLPGEAHETCVVQMRICGYARPNHIQTTYCNVAAA
jgi:hypothetical protein